MRSKRKRNLGAPKPASIEFCLTNIKPLNTKQSQVLESTKHLVLLGSAGTGKAQPASAKIKTPYGWTTMGSIKVGDTIKCPDNTVAIVEAKHYNSCRPIYKLILADGRETEASLDHLWEVYIQDKKDTITLTTAELIDKVNTIKSGKVYLPLCSAIEDKTDENILPIHPYILGVLIGDGSLTTEQAIFYSNDSEIVDRVASFLPEDHEVVKMESAKFGYRISNIKNKYENLIQKGLRDLGIAGHKSYTKFIPDIYINQSIENKLLLLQGLMDTDGTIDTKNSIEFSTTSEVLANQVVMLIRSLGGTCTSISRMGSYKKSEKTVETCINYRVRPSRLPFEIKKQLFSLTRKVARVTKGQYDNSKKIRVSSIQYVRDEECWCIQIDHPKHLYLTDSYIVTHNTFLASYLAYQDLFEEVYSRLVYIRSAVATRDIGFLPGNDKEKVAVYEAPYMDIASDLLQRGDAYEILKKKGLVHFMSTSFIRGTTLKDAVIIVDECQNMTYHELDSIITRLGQNCRIILCGDIKQADLQKNGFKDFYEILRRMNEFDFIEFTKEDIVRSDFVKNYIITKDALHSSG